MPRRSPASLSSACLPVGLTTDLSKSNSESADSDTRIGAGGAAGGGGGGGAGGAATITGAGAAATTTGSRRSGTRWLGLGAEPVDQADRKQVGMALVAHRILEPVALGLGAYRQRVVDVVHQAQAELRVGAALAGIGIGIGQPGRARRAEAVAAAHRGDADTPERGELACQGQGAHQVEVQAFHADVAVQGSRRHGIGRVAEMSEIEKSGFDADVRRELVAAEQLVAGVRGRGRRSSWCPGPARPGRW